MILQVQPRLERKESWEGFSEKEGLFYELLEFSLPGNTPRTEALSYYRNTGRAKSFHGAFIDVNPASAEPKICDISRSIMEQSCKDALAAGCTDIVFHSSAHPFLNGAYLTRWAQKSADFFTGLYERYGLSVHVENSADAYPDALCALTDALGNREGTDICLDIGHANYSDVPLCEWFSKLGEKIGYIHLSDNFGKFDDHLPLGQGSVSCEEADRLIRKYGAAKKITLEMNTLEESKAALSFIREHRYFEGL